VCPCTEEGVRGAIAAGGGPYAFDCDAPTTVVTTAEIVIDRDVTLDGEGLLAVDADYKHRVFSVGEGVTAELQRIYVKRGVSQHGGGIANAGSLTIRGGAVDDCITDLFWGNPSGHGPVGGSGIHNAGEMLIFDSRVSGNAGVHTSGGGIKNASSATLTLMNSTVSGNFISQDGDASGGGIVNGGEMTIVNSTISENDAAGLFGSSGGGIANGGWMSLTNSTVSGNSAQSEAAIVNYHEAYLEIASSLLDGECGDSVWDGSEKTWVSKGYNIESPDNTCGFGQSTDLFNVTEEELNLGELADNGGPTMTHKPGDGDFGEDSIAIDWIPGDACDLTEDQRGEPRPETGGTRCDVGSVEVQPEL